MPTRSPPRTRTTAPSPAKRLAVARRAYARQMTASLGVDNPVHPTDSLRLTIHVKNTGPAEGDEITQVYIAATDARVPVPIRSLRAFRRIHLQPGEEQTLHFSVAPDAFTVIDDKMQKAHLPGRYGIAVGGGQPGSSRQGTSNSVETIVTLP